MRRKIRSSTAVDVHDLPLNPIYLQSLRALGVKIRTESHWMNAVSATVYSKDQLEAVFAFPWIIKGECVGKFKEAFDPTTESQKRFDSLAYSTDALSLLGITELQQMGYTGQNITIAVLDSGFNLAHNAFGRLKVKKTYDFVNNRESVAIESAHGTATLSLIGGNEPGKFLGGAYSATFLLGKTEALQYEEKKEEDFFVAALEWAEKNGADIVSSSLGYYQWWNWEDFDGNHSVASRAIDVAYSKGLPVVVSIGNYGRDTIACPADARGALAVGATDSDKNPSFFSSRGPTYDGRIKPDVVALGTSVICADENTGYTRKSGTSFSAPLVASMVALLLQARPSWKISQLYEAIKQSSSHAKNPTIEVGWGFVDGKAALEYSPGECETSCVNGICNEAGLCQCNKGYYGEFCNQKPLQCQAWCFNYVARCMEDICYCLTSDPNKPDRHCSTFHNNPNWDCSIALYNDSKTCDFCGLFQDPDCKGYQRHECDGDQIPIDDLPQRCSAEAKEISLTWDIHHFPFLFIPSFIGLIYVSCLWGAVARGQTMVPVVTQNFAEV